MDNMICPWIDQHRDALLDLTARLVATPSANPPGDERAVVRVILDEMDRLGLTGAETVGHEPHRPNLIIRLGNQTAGPTLMLCGHTDTKPVGDSTDWKTDPLDAVVRDGKLYGLGSTDMKGAVAAMIYATAALQKCKVQLGGQFIFVANADEERTMKGSEFLVTEYGLEADVALLGEPSGIAGDEFEYLHLLSRGITCFRVCVHGTQMHSSLSDRMPCVNASVKLAQVLTQMNDDLKLTFDPHPLCDGPTVNLGVKLEGGVGYGVYPGTAEFKCDIRTLPGMSEGQLRSDLERFVEKMRERDSELDLEILFEDPPLNWMSPTEVSADHPLVGSLLSASKDILGRRPILSAFPGGTDAAKFHGLGGIPTIPSFGPGWLPLAHGPNECVGVEAIVQAAKIYALAAQRYLRPGS